MAEGWITSWYWSRRPVGAAPPSAPQVISEPRATEMARIFAHVAITPSADESTPFLALAHARLAATPELDRIARLEYRVSPRVRFPNSEGARGAARQAIDHVRRLEAVGQLAPTRGPFHLSEILAQGGLAAVTLRADVLHAESLPRLATYLPLAVTFGGGPLEPMNLALLDIATEKLVWCPDDAFSRAWHSPMAGGEILALLPGFESAPRTRSGSFRAPAAAGQAEAQTAAPPNRRPSTGRS